MYIYTPLCRYWITLYRYVLVFIVPHVDIELEDNKQFISNIPRISNFRMQITYAYAKCGCSTYFFAKFCKSDMSKDGYIEVFQRVLSSPRQRELTIYYKPQRNSKPTPSFQTRRSLPDNVQNKTWKKKKKKKKKSRSEQLQGHTMNQQHQHHRGFKLSLHMPSFLIEPALTCD